MTTLAIGSVFAGYVIDEIVARGGMGVVYRATQVQPSRRVALKLIAPEYASDPSYRDRFLREADLLASLDDCPSIVPIYAAGEAEGQLYLAMRFLDGPDLATLIKNEGRLSLTRTAGILWPVATALDAAHEAGLVHRDVKPSNIMFDRRSAVYLMDFGLTKRADSESGLTRPGQAIGTAGYMAPEQFTGRTNDPALVSRIDVYALGCVLHACLTGEEPFPHDGYERALFAHVYEPPPKLSARRPDLTAELDDVLARAMSKDPRDRFARASDLAGAVRDLARVSPGVVPPPAVTAATPTSVQHDVVPPAPDRHRIDSTVTPSPAGPPSVETVLAARPAGGPAPVPSWAARSVGGVDRSRRRFAIAAAGVGATLLAGLLLIGQFSGPGPGAGSTASPSARAETSSAPSPTAAPTARPTPAPTPTPTIAPGTGTAADVAALIATLPEEIGKSCVSGELLGEGAIATVRCDHAGGLVWYTRFRDRATMYADYQISVDLSKLTPDAATCDGGVASESSWNFTPAEGEEPVSQGRLLCRIGGGDAAFLDFTVDATLTIASIVDSDGDLKALYDIWAEGSIFPVIP